MNLYFNQRFECPLNKLRINPVAVLSEAVKFWYKEQERPPRS